MPDGPEELSGQVWPVVVVSGTEEVGAPETTGVAGQHERAYHPATVAEPNLKVRYPVPDQVRNEAGLRH